MKKNIVAIGNSSFANAGVICFPEHHRDTSYSNMIAHVINSNYRAGDVLLIEGIASGDINLENKKHPLSSLNKGFKADCVVRGWELKILRHCLVLFLEKMCKGIQNLSPPSAILEILAKKQV